MIQGYRIKCVANGVFQIHFLESIMRDASYWIDKLELQKHPEGGYFRETYRSGSNIQPCCLGNSFDGSRSISTAIYFLLSGAEFSAFHRIRSDEIWHHYDGTSLTIHIIDATGEYIARCLGNTPDQHAFPQALVTAGSWFGATVNEQNSFALVGCTVAPGFDFKDFEMGKREDLIRRYPNHRGIIEGLTHS